MCHQSDGISEHKTVNLISDYRWCADDNHVNIAWKEEHLNLGPLLGGEPLTVQQSIPAHACEQLLWGQK